MTLFQKKLATSGASGPTAGAPERGGGEDAQLGLEAVREAVEVGVSSIGRAARAYVSQELFQYLA